MCRHAGTCGWGGHIEGRSRRGLVGGLFELPSSIWSPEHFVACFVKAVLAATDVNPLIRGHGCEPADLQVLSRT